MAASSFVLRLSLVLLVTTQGCSAQLGHKEPALISTLQDISNSTVESLRLHRQNTAALSDLQALPDMLQLVKEQITLEMEKNMGSMKKELAGLNKESENANQIQDLKSWIEGRDERVTALRQEIQDLRAQLEARSHTVETYTQENQKIKQKYEEERKKVQNLEERLSVSAQQVNILTENQKTHNSTVQDLNKRLQESELRVQELERMVQKLNQTREEEEVDQDSECRQPQLQKVQAVMHRFKSSNDLRQLWEDLESAMDICSEEYDQMQSTGRGDLFAFRIGQSGHTKLAMLLLCAGLPADMAGSHGDTMLHGAAWTGQVLLVKFLLKHGAQLETRGMGQFTPLIRAAYKGHLEVVKLLVEAGANTTAKDEEGLTALEAARDYRHTAVVQYLQPLPH